MSMGQLYHYISSKDDVLYLVHKYMHQQWFDSIIAEEDTDCKDPVQRLINSLNRNLIFVNENKKLIQFILTESKYLDKHHLEIILEMEKKYTIDHYRRLLEDINKNVPLNADLDVIASIVAYVTPFITLRGWTVKDKPVAEVNRYLLNFIIQGLGLSFPEDIENR